MYSHNNIKAMNQGWKKIAYTVFRIGWLPTLCIPNSPFLKKNTSNRLMQCTGENHIQTKENISINKISFLIFTNH